MVYMNRLEPHANTRREIENTISLGEHSFTEVPKAMHLTNRKGVCLLTPAPNVNILLKYTNVGGAFNGDWDRIPHFRTVILELFVAKSVSLEFRLLNTAAVT